MMKTRLNDNLRACAHKDLQARFVSDGLADAFCLARMVSNLQSRSAERNAQIVTEVATTLDLVAGTLEGMSAEGAASAPSKDMVALLGGVVALCVDVLLADIYRPSLPGKGGRP